jgi:hypothetical protein
MHLESDMMLSSAVKMASESSFRVDQSTTHKILVKKKKKKAKKLNTDK